MLLSLQLGSRCRSQGPGGVCSTSPLPWRGRGPWGPESGGRPLCAQPWSPFLLSAHRRQEGTHCTKWGRPGGWAPASGPVSSDVPEPPRRGAVRPLQRSTQRGPRRMTAASRWSVGREAGSWRVRPGHSCPDRPWSPLLPSCSKPSGQRGANSQNRWWHLRVLPPARGRGWEWGAAPEMHPGGKRGRCETLLSSRPTHY